MKDLNKSTILAVDDVALNLDVIIAILGSDYDIKVATDGETALKIVEKDPPDLILLDIMMPGMSGYQVLEKLKKSPLSKDIPVLCLTAIIEIENKTKGFHMGAVDYITKPFEPSELKARVSTHLALKLAKDQLNDQNKVLEEKVRERTLQLQITQDVTIRGLAALAEQRDDDMGSHIIRTQNYVEALAIQLRQTGHYVSFFTEETIKFLKKSAALHDIGKVGIPDQILLKPGKLTCDEFEIMKMHSVYGKKTLEKAETGIGSTSFLHHAKLFSISHHEKWDGSGYPNGLKGDDIPIEGRLMAIADVYDALISRRVYKPPFSHSKAVSIIESGKGKDFDPDFVDNFIAISEDFRQIAMNLVESEEELQALTE
jgi:putative two-component system response regulator